MAKGDKKFVLSVGSDESGNGGLFGGCSFAAFKLTEGNLEVLKGQKWFEFLVNVMDPKNMDYNWVVYLSKNIREIFRENEDFYIFTLNAARYNEIYRSLENYHPEKTIKWLAHISLQKMWMGDDKDLIHVLDDFIGRKEWIFFDLPWRSEIAENLEFCVGGESEYISVALASILAKDAYLEQFRQIQEDLGVSILNKANYNHRPSPKKLEPILSVLRETKGDVWKKYCKEEVLKKYEKDLVNFRSQPR